MFPFIEQVNDDAVAIHITSRKGSAVLISEDEYNSLKETRYLLRSPASAERLTRGIAQLESGEVIEVDLNKLVNEL